MRTAYPDTRSGAIQCLTDNAIEAVSALAAQRVADGTAAWRPDPEVPDVWGLVRTTGERMQADIVVYTADADFTVSDAFTTEALS